ncbi:MAG: 6-phosphofructokinase [Chloroflexi bacterium]|nr:6-phosphofructokinase [Chloroflexota bacterium]
MRIGVLTGGGDVPGLNAAIRAVTRRSWEHGNEVLAIRNGWEGLIVGNISPMTEQMVSGILHVGGTVLGSSRTNPFKSESNVQKVLDTIRKYHLDVIIPIGGEDTLTVGSHFSERGVPVVGVPKTMDNDVYGTDFTIGFDTAVTTVTDALDKLHTTASSHHRVLVVEVMGRHAGWVAVVGGLAGGADMILIPEVKSGITEICAHVRWRWQRGKTFSIIVVSEGADVEEISYDDESLGAKDEFGHVRLDRRGLAETIAKEVEKRTGFEARAVVLGHLQRGGSPTVSDRVLATRLGVKAADLAKERQFGLMAALQGSQIVAVPLQEAMSRLKTVDLELYDLARTFF